MTDEERLDRNRKRRALIANDVHKLESLIPSYDNYIAYIKMLINNHPTSYFNLLTSNRFVKIWSDIIEKTKFLDEYFTPNAATRVFYYIHKFTSILKCNTCGKDYLKQISNNSWKSYVYCCNRCAQKSPDTIAKTKNTKLERHGDPNYNNMDKTRKTCKERYGVEYSWQSDVVKDAIKKTTKEKYGVDHHMKSNEVKNQMKQRYKEKYGVEYVWQNPDVKAKIIASNQEKYGYDWIMQSPEMRKIMHQHSSKTQKLNYYNNVIMNDGEVEPLFSFDQYYALTKDHYFYEFDWICKKCGKTFVSRILRGTTTKYVARCPHCHPILKTSSQFEREIANYIISIDPQFEVVNRNFQQNRNIIPPNEIDIIVKKNNQIKLLIEADGLFWHSATNGKDQFYHVLKTQQCQDLGYQLIHIFDDEWRNKQEIVKSRLKTILGKYDKRIFARKCTVEKLSSKVANSFFDETHIQGKCQASIRYGLMYDGQLVAAMAFGHMRRITNNKKHDDEYEMLRFSTKLGHQVVGGASRLLSAFEKEFHPKKLTSYADRRWSIGKLYNALGFTLDHISSPNYWYIDSRHTIRMYRYGFRKSQLPKILKAFDPNKTEMENMVANGYDYIWDCGNYVFVKNYV